MWYYELATPDALVPAAPPRQEGTVIPLASPRPELNRFLYEAVGTGLAWVDRRPWSVDRWREHLEEEGRSTLLLTSDGVPAGYAELDASTGDGSVEIAYFGVAPWARGLGLGGLLLTEAARRAWALQGTTRVWLHTCELDGEHARANYERRGFRLAGATTRLQTIPEDMLASGVGRPPPRPDVRLRPMTADEYARWYPHSTAAYADEKVRNGTWSQEEAPERALAEFARLLPQGLATPGNWLFAIEAESERVGILWVAGQERGRLFIYDIEIDPEHQRRGYARGALEALDRVAADLGYSSIGLHVFGFNEGARALYRLTGYVETDVTMVKDLPG